VDVTAVGELVVALYRRESPAAREEVGFHSRTTQPWESKHGRDNAARVRRRGYRCRLQILRGIISGLGWG
jgi:hypothetical protein